jgi:hypothetical protein
MQKKAVALVIALAATTAMAQNTFTTNITVPFDTPVAISPVILALMAGDLINNTCTPDAQVLTLTSPPQHGSFGTTEGSFVFTGAGPCNGVTGPTIQAFYAWTGPQQNGATDSLTYTGTYGNGGPVSTYIVNITLSAPSSCPVGTLVNASLPTVQVNKLLQMKPLQVTYGALSLTFSISQSGALCQAQSAIEHLPVLVNSQHLADSIASATLTLYPSGTITGLNACNFSPKGGLANGCLLNGSFDPNATYLQWSTSGFTTQAVVGKFISPPLPFSTGPLIFWLNLSSLGWENLGLPAIIQNAEPYVHQTLISNLPAIAWYTFIQDPGDVTVLVINRDGKTSGTLPDGRETDDIPQSLVYESQLNPAVLLQGSLTNTETVLLTGIQSGSYDLVISNLAGQSTGSQQEVTGPIALGQMATYVINSSVLNGVPSQTVTSTTASREDLNGDGIVNCADLAIVSEAYGASTANSAFNAWADVNNDGIINLLDLQAVIQKIPAGCPNQLLVHNVTFASTLADIQVALTADLISNRTLATELTEKMREAESSASQGGESDDAREALNQFIHLVNLQSGKQIVGIASQLLQQDGAALLAILPRSGG